MLTKQVSLISISFHFMQGDQGANQLKQQHTIFMLLNSNELHWIVRNYLNYSELQNKIRNYPKTRLNYSILWSRWKILANSKSILIFGFSSKKGVNFDVASPLKCMYNNNLNFISICIMPNEYRIKILKKFFNFFNEIQRFCPSMMIHLSPIEFSSSFFLRVIFSPFSFP